MCVCEREREREKERERENYLKYFGVDIMNVGKIAGKAGVGKKVKICWEG